MAGFNNCVLVGNLCDDPRDARTQSGKSVANIRLAVNEPYTDQHGAKQENTLFVNVVAWAGLADAVSKYLRKGAKVLVQGRLSEDKYTRKDGTEVVTLEVVAQRVEFLDSKRDAEDRDRGR